MEKDFGDLSKQIEEVRAKRDEFNASTQDLIRLLRETNGKIREHLKKATTFREKRDGFNENVQAAKNNRITTQIALEELRKRLDEIKEKNKEIKPLDKSQQAQITKLRQAVRRKNMEIETKPDLSTSDEDRLIKDIEQLEGQLASLTKGTEARREYSAIIGQFPVYKAQLKKYHDEVVENSEESQKYHEFMLKEYDNVDAMREKIGKLEKELAESRKQADVFHSELLALYKKRDSMRTNIQETHREVRTQRRKERGNVALQLRRLAKERLDRGERLDFVEFRLLHEKNDIDLVAGPDAD